MGAFSGLKDAKRGFQSNPLQPGKYVCRIDACDFFETDNSGEMWKNTLTVLAVEDGPHKAGEVVHTFFKVGTGAAGKTTFQSNLKAFMVGVLACDDDDIGEAEAKQATAENSPMKGLVTIVTARQRQSKDKKDDEGLPRKYTVYSWSPSLTNEEIVAAIGEEAFATFFPNG